MIHHDDNTDAEIYPCAVCGKLRSVNQGASVFIVCDDCWDKHYAAEARIAELEQRQSFAAGNVALDQIESRDKRIAALEAEVKRLRADNTSMMCRLEIRYAMARELEQLLGVPHDAPSDEQLRIGVEAVRRLLAEAKRLRSLIPPTFDEKCDALRDAVAEKE